MSFSVSEKDYLYQSLSSKTPIRPDGRKSHQLRGIEASINFLPNSNGSSRIRLSDGSEVIISIKSKVVKMSTLADLIELDLTIDNLRDDLTFISDWTNILRNSLLRNFADKFECLKLTTRYYFKLYVDVLFLSSSSNARTTKTDTSFLQNPLSMISFGIYLALKSTRLPLLISNSNDKDIEELPTFNDDWSSTVLLYPQDEDEEIKENNTTSQNSSSPPLLFVLSVVKNNLFIDPSIEEQEISDCGLVIGWCSGKVVSPIESLNLNQSGSSEYIKGMHGQNIIEGIKMIENVAATVSKGLDEIVKDGNNSVFMDSIF
ncbi:exosome non-catalytic core subunit [Saccharomycopsis crataegensis]|uniref:Ribosomal RNA-processing protein 42 n=1 Tax=Saccharomycopsis crataegensis TaxID=43959 RepID=A0AAV5QUV1_9ASCO|nr:exosome non-catalytic core subunit [Saccharomycopsis crataegensis]